MADKDSGGGGGDPIGDLWWFLIIMVVLGSMWVAGGGPQRYANRPPSKVVRSPLVTGPLPTPESLRNNGRSKTSVSAVNYQKVTISKGSAASKYQPGEEYIVLTASRSNSTPISITGWRLANGRDQKLFLNQGKFFTQTSNQAVIPTGAVIFDPNGKHAQGAIVLKPGEKAYVVTGSGQYFGDYPIKTSFRTNKCLGYVEEQNGYKLTPPLPAGKCPDPEKEVALNKLPDSCYDFVRGLARCHTPEKGENRDGDFTVDGKTGIPKTCVNFILPILNYESCVKRHLTDVDFFGNEWRVYLGQRWEMWGARRETITLYDTAGQIIDQLTY